MIPPRASQARSAVATLGAPLAALALLFTTQVTVAANYRARYMRAQDPQLLQLQLYQLESGIEADYTYEETTFRDSGTRSTFERSYVAPSLSIGANGSIYHPNFMRFDLFGTGSYGWGEQETDSGTRITRDSIQHFENFRGRFYLLPGKPLHADGHGSYGRSYRDFDFFTRSTVETLSYGAQTVYQVPTFYTVASYAHADEKILDTARPTSTEHDLASFDTHQYRRAGSSSFNYTYSQTRFTGSDPQSGNATDDHAMSVTDTENLGPQERTELRTSASYSHRESEGDPTDQFTVNASEHTEHRTNLHSSASVSYDQFSVDDFDTQSMVANADVMHQLYESLASTLSAQGANTETTSDGESVDDRRVGAGIAEAYSKRLGDEHRLQMDYALFLDNVDQSGGAGRAVNERHAFPVPPAIESFLLSLPEVEEDSIVVTDASIVRRFVRGIDYELFPVGSRTEIRRIPGGTIPEGSIVLVSYDAAPGGSGTYWARTQTAGVRLHLWQDLWALYARVNTSVNDAPANVYAQEVTIYTYGTDLRWRQMRAGAEQEYYDSTDSEYHATRFYESLWYNPDHVSSLTLGLSQTFTEHEEADRREQDYRYTMGYRRAVSRRLRASLHAGFDQRRGTGVDQDLTVVRPEIDYRIGQTTLEAYYNYEHNLYLDNEERNKHLFAATLKRRF